MSMNWDEQLTIGAELADGHDAAADGDADPTKVEGIAMATDCCCLSTDFSFSVSFDREKSSSLRDNIIRRQLILQRWKCFAQFSSSSPN